MSDHRGRVVFGLLILAYKQHKYEKKLVLTTSTIEAAFVSLLDFSCFWTGESHAVTLAEDYITRFVGNVHTTYYWN